MLPGAEWVAEQVLGLHPLGDGTEIPVLQGAGARPAALHAQWQDQGPGGQAASLQAGRLAYTHAPGFAACLLRYLTAAQVPSQDPAHATAAAALLAAQTSRVADSASSSPDPTHPAGSQRSSQTGSMTIGANARMAGWIQGGLSISVSAGAMQLAALSSVDAHAAAIVLSVGRLSARLGAIRAGTRPGSLTAKLFLLHR